MKERKKGKAVVPREKKEEEEKKESWSGMLA